VLGRRRARVVGHDEVLRAATDVLSADGPLAVTEKRLADALGVPERQLDVDLDAVLAEAYRGLSAAESARVKRTILANPSPVEQMRALLAVLATPPEDNSDAFRLAAWALARDNPALRSAVQDSAAAWHALVASVIRRGARTGHFHETDADEVAAHVISLIEGINSYQLIGYRSDFDRMRLLTRVLRAELGMVWGAELTDALN
jgi:AcrR family transcriptional regulator